MRVTSVTNQYFGINAHLHSLWQGKGGWNSFHTVHIGDLYKTLNVHLIPMGYIAEVEESLQVRRIGETARHPKADVLIRDTHPMASSLPTSTRIEGNRIPVLELLAEDEVSDKPFRALSILEVDPETMERGEPVAWIELLSPSNKQGEDGEVYRAKRMDVMVSGLVFVEIDYLHETRPTFPTIPNYRMHRQYESSPSLPHPYHLIVIDPRPKLEKGWALVTPIDVDQPLPTVEIPLNGNDVLSYDFGTAYKKTFEEGLYGRKVDYTQLPLNFDRYSPADQRRIACRMLAVLEAVQEKADLETGPFPVKDISLDDALKRIEALI